MKIIFPVFVLATILLSCGQEKKSVEKPPISNHQLLKDSLTAELDSIAKNGQLNGFAVSISNQDGTLYEKGFGYANRETKEEYTEHTIQHIASVSKTLIGIALMKAQEMGKLSLDDSIDKYLPFAVRNHFYPEERISIRQLATHTSGINDTEQYMDHAWIITAGQDLSKVNTDYPEQRLNPAEKNIPMEEYLSGYLLKGEAYYQDDNFIAFKPGERYNYSNIGATLAALVIEKATGSSFDSFTNEHILGPLKMTASGWSLEDVDISKHSRLYRTDNTVIPFYTAITYPDGMLISSSSDMAKYQTELINGYSGEGTLLSKESYAELFEKQLNEEHFEEGDRNPDHPYDEDYDPAIFIGHSALGYVGHSGGDAGVGTWFFFNKETGTGRYIVKNTDSGDDNRARELQYYAIWDKMDEYLERLNKSAR